MRKTVGVWLLVLGFLLSACSSYQRGPTAFEVHGKRGQLTPGASYTIQRGDTLFGIAWRYGLDVDDLARWNGIANPDRILAGQTLRTTPPYGASVATPVQAPRVTTSGQAGWIWPTHGKVIQTFSENAPGQQGIRLSGGRGQAVNAASSGEVAYVGTGLSGFGRMVIIRHGGRVLSAYGYLNSVNVRERQKVQRGQIIGTMGVGPRNIPTLHFETRKQGKPVNPYSYIGTQPRFS